MGFPGLGKIIAEECLIVKIFWGVAMNENDKFSFESIHALSRAFQQSRVFLTAFELGIFTALGDEDKSSDEIAVETRVDPV
jgi:hypothetical protein